VVVGVHSVSDDWISDVYAYISGTIASDATGTCASCGIGTYKTTPGSALCIGCPSDSNAAEGSNKVSDCTCNRGYTGANGGLCVACIAGKYKVATGNTACTNCVAGQYSTAVGATSDVCEACVTNTKSIEASDKQTDCTCNSGYTGANGGPCKACIAGKYKVATGDAACTNCVAGKYSIGIGATSNVCQTCATNSDSMEASDEQTDCICNSGYTGANGGPCGECSAGKFWMEM